MLSSKLKYGQNESGPEGAVEWEKVVLITGGEGGVFGGGDEREDGRSVWVNFDWDLRIGVEEALEQQRALTGFVEGSELVLKTTVLEENLDGWPGSLQRRVQVPHAGTMCLSEAGLALSRITPPPTLSASRT